jgi:hypothetical protein
MTNNLSISALLKTKNLIYDSNNLYSYISSCLNTSNQTDYMKSIDSLITFVDSLKSHLDKFENNITILDMYFTAIYILTIQVANKKDISILTTKAFFNFNIFYNELGQSDKAGFVILKYFELESRTFENSLNNNNLTELFQTNLQRIQTFKVDSDLSYILSLISFKSIKLNDAKVNFVISLLNIAINRHKCLETVYDWLHINKSEFKDINFSAKHLNNLIKLIYKLDEIVVENFIYNKDIFNNGIKKLLTLAFNIKILLYTLTSDNLMHIFLSNHLTQIILIFRDFTITDKGFIDDYLNTVGFYKFIDLITGEIILKLGQDDQITIYAKLYNICKNLNLTAFAFNFGNIILQFQKDFKIIIVETVLILLNGLKEFINENRNNIVEGLQTIADYLDNIQMAFVDLKLKDNNDAKNLIAIIRFLVKISDNMIYSIITNNIQNLESFRFIFHKLNNIFTKLSANNSIKNVSSEISYFLIFLKILNESENSKQNYFQKFLSYKTEDTRIRLNVLIGSLAYLNDYNNIIVLGLLINKSNSDLLTEFLNILFIFFEKLNFSDKQFKFVEFVLELLNIITLSEIKNFDNKLLQRLENCIIRTFRSFIKSLNNKNVSELNTFLNYYNILTESLKKLNCEIYTDVIVFFELLNNFDLENLFNLESNGCNILKQILSSDFLTLLDLFRETNSSFEAKRAIQSIVVQNISIDCCNKNYKKLYPYPMVHCLMDRLNSVNLNCFNFNDKTAGVKKLFNKIDFLVLKEQTMLEIILTEILGYEKQFLISKLEKLNNFAIPDGLFKDYIYFEICLFNNDKEGLTKLLNKLISSFKESSKNDVS